ncbi:hypothetical protein C8J57DRAFT_1525975 [Mycena rebaudengoi]|nr:hypothetical protein C8J57DRAFT_1525975 [Mycena rebaudengoi]
MVLTRRASKCILRWLPNELLSTITTFAPLADKVSLARVSKVIHALVIPSLYRTVVLHNYAQLRRFSELLIAKPERANAVRAFYMSDIAADSFEGALLPVSNYQVLSTMLRLEILELEVVSPTDERYLRILRHCTFPQLRDFKYISPISTKPVIEPFLIRHPEISRLVIGGLDPGPVTPNVSAPLHKLRYYVGPTTFMDLFPPGINQMVLLWTLENADVDASIAKLAPLTEQGAQLIFSSLYVRDARGSTFESLSRHLPHTQCIQLRSAENQTGRLGKEYLEAVARCLGNFTTLRYLALEFLALLDFVRSPTVVSEEEYGADRATVEKWGRACPSLRECCFHGNAWQLSEEGWNPVEEEELKEFKYQKY